MLIANEIRSNFFYYYFLKSVLFLVQTVPPYYGKLILQGAKILVGIFPMISLAAVSMSSVLVQNYFNRGGNTEIEKSEPINEEDNQIKSLEKLMKGEQNERQILQKSSEILMECIKGLQRKLDTEIICRKSYQRESDKQKDIYVEKVEKIEERLDYLKSSLKRGILGMDKVLRGIKDARCEAAGDFHQSDVQNCK